MTLPTINTPPEQITRYTFGLVLLGSVHNKCGLSQWDAS